MKPIDSHNQGQTAASSPSVFLWGLFGLAMTPIALAIVYIRSPTVPAALAVTRDGDDARFFEKGYIERLKSRQVRSVWIGTFFAVVLSVVVFFVFMALAAVAVSSVSSDSAVSEAFEELTAAPPVTAEQFAQIQEGMTYERVVDIIGTEGTVMSSSNMAGIETVMYEWSGGLTGVTVMFQDGRMVVKSQFGL